MVSAEPHDSGSRGLGSIPGLGQDTLYSDSASLPRGV